MSWAIRRWVEEIRGLTTPDDVVYCDGSEEERARLTAECLAPRELIALKQDKLFLRRLTAPLAIGNVVAVGDVEGYVHFLSRESGAFVGRVATDGSPIQTSLLRLEQGLLVQTQEGNLFAIGLR